MTLPPPNIADIAMISTTTDDGQRRTPGVSRRHDVVGQLGSKPGGSGGSPKMKSTCEYDERGWCNEHGQGIQKYKGTHVMAIGKDGKRIKKYARQPYYVCDVSLGGKKLKQSKINFLKLTAGSVDKGGRADDNSKGVGGQDFCTSTEGQTRGCGRVAGSMQEKGTVQ